MRPLFVGALLLITSNPQQMKVTASFPNPITNVDAELLWIYTPAGNVHYRIKIGRSYLSRPYPDISGFNWSPDYKHFYFVAQEDVDQYRIIEDGRPHCVFDSVLQMQWSDSSQHLAYIGIINIGTPDVRSIVVYDGVPLKTFHEVTDLYFLKNDELVFKGTDP